MMTGQNPFEFITLNESADERSGGRVVSWINYWWKDKTGAAWGEHALKRLSPYYWFELHTQDSPILLTPLPAAMETVVEVFNEDCLAHLHIPHVFSIPCLMTHLWRRQLSKDAYFLFTINVGDMGVCQTIFIEYFHHFFHCCWGGVQSLGLSCVCN